jgi:hypothetical protein
MLQLFAEGQTNFLYIKNDGLKKIHSDSSRLLVTLETMVTKNHNSRNGESLMGLGFKRIFSWTKKEIKIKRHWKVANKWDLNPSHHTSNQEMKEENYEVV